MPSPLLELTVHGFKSLRDSLRLSVRPLTLLTGRNSAGKSSFMQPFLLLKQTLEVAFDPGPLYLSGPNTDVTPLDRITWRGGDPQFRIGLDLEGHAEARWTFGASGGTPSVIATSARSRASHIELVGNRVEHRILAEALVSPDLPPLRVEDLHVTWRTFLPNVSHPSGRINAVSPYQPVVDLISGWIHVPSIRETPRDSYAPQGDSLRFPGRFDRYVPALLERWGAEPARLARISDDLRALGLTDQVRANRTSPTSVALEVSRRAGAEDEWVALRDVGFGVSQVLPVLVALEAAAPGQVVYIEQPELHLHPAAEAALASILLRAARRGVRVIAETHAALLLRGVQTAAAASESDGELVALHWFDRDQDGATQVTSGTLDANGAFGDWPVDFGAVEQEVDLQFLKASLGR